MVEPIEPVEEVSRTQKAWKTYAAYHAALDAPSAYSGMLIPVPHQVKIFSLLSNHEVEVVESTLKNKQIELREQTKRAKEDEKALHERIPQNQITPKNSLKGKVEKIDRP